MSWIDRRSCGLAEGIVARFPASWPEQPTWCNRITELLFKNLVARWSDGLRCSHSPV